MIQNEFDTLSVGDQVLCNNTHCREPLHGHICLIMRIDSSRLSYLKCIDDDSINRIPGICGKEGWNGFIATAICSIDILPRDKWINTAINTTIIDSSIYKRKSFLDRIVEWET